MPNRHYSNSTSYRYGFNGKEKDDETTSTSTYDYGFRIYNPALGRFLSVDPLTNSYPWYTPYQFAGNKPIEAIDLDGLEEFFIREGENGNEWFVSVRRSGIESEKGKNTYQLEDINRNPVGVIKPITPDLEFYAKSVNKEFDKTGRQGGVYRTKGPILTKTDAGEIHKKAEKNITERGPSDDTKGKEIVDATPPPPFQLLGELTVFDNSNKLPNGYKIGKDFMSFATQLYIYLIRNPNACIEITMGGGYFENNSGGKEKKWSDFIDPIAVFRKTYSDKIDEEFKKIVEQVNKIGKGTIKAEERLIKKEGKVESLEIEEKAVPKP